MSIADELERLDDLRRNGVLSEEEFAVAKRRLLASDRGQGLRREVLPTWADGRMPLAVTSTVMLVALFLPWVELLFFRVNAVELAGIILGTGDALRDLAELFDISARAISRAELATIGVGALVVATVAAPIQRRAEVRNRQALIGAGVVILLFLNGIRYSLTEFVAFGAYVFLTAAVAHALIAGSVLRYGDLVSALALVGGSRPVALSTSRPSTGSPQDDARPQVSVGFRFTWWIAHQPFKAAGLLLGIVVVLVLAATRPVPDVRGQDPSSAASVLRSAGFSTVESTRVDDNAPEGSVVDQLPRAGSRALRGSAVTLSVSSLPRFTLNGELQLFLDPSGSDDNCYGPGSDGFWEGGRPIVVLDGAGDVLASGSFRNGVRAGPDHPRFEHRRYCSLTFEITDIRQSASYTVDFGRQIFEYSHEEMVAIDWNPVYVLD